MNLIDITKGLVKNSKNWFRISVVGLACLFFTLPSSVMAQENYEDDESGDESSIELNASFVSNYVWRGENIFGARADQTGKLPTATTGYAAFQPNVTFYQPGGWYFDIWASYAMGHRNDVDANEDGTIDLDGEANGLQRSDEVNYTIGHEQETRIGTVGFGVLHYIYPKLNPRVTTFATDPNTGDLFLDSDGNPYIGSATEVKTFPDTEIFFSYSPPGEYTSGIYVNLFSALIAEYEYYQIGYAYDFELGESLNLNFDIALGYQISQDAISEEIGTYGYVVQKSGLKDTTMTIGIDTHGFNVGIGVAVRGQSEFYDYEGDKTDFQVTDPESETNELEDLPRALYWLYLGYSHEL